MYRDGYGYKSGINESMVNHLSGVVDLACMFVQEGDSVLDIGCNDGTLLKSWGRFKVWRYGFDPIAEDVPGCEITKDYFKPTIHRYKVITSLSMFYDLQDPVSFARDVKSCLHPHGIWLLEVGYAGTVLDGKWDGICHEHLEYYGLTQIANIAARVGLQIKRHWFNDTNGGSILVMLGHYGQDPELQATIEKEKVWNWDGLGSMIADSIDEIKRAVGRYGTVHALGASTKGNALLQACGLALEAAVDRNPDKEGRFIAGTPIKSEAWGAAHKPDAYLVLPYHFRDSLKARHPDDTLIFPLPKVEVC